MLLIFILHEQEHEEVISEDVRFLWWSLKILPFQNSVGVFEYDPFVFRIHQLLSITFQKQKQKPKFYAMI